MTQRARILAVLGVLVVASPVFAQGDLSGRVDRLEREVRKLDRKLEDAAAPAGLVLILFGAFCALWAQNTDRNPWLWFFLGLLFSVVTVFVLLSKNADDRKRRR